MAAAVGENTPAARWLGEVKRRLNAPVDIAGICVVRVVLGAVLVWEVCRYFVNGWIDRYWIDPPLALGYYGFEWVQPLPGPGMYALFVLLGFCAAGVFLGLGYRLSITLFFVGFTYSFLLQQARYLNHFYLICLLTFLLMFIPAHGWLSVDAWRRPNLRRNTVPAWMLWILRFQLGVAYFYGGVAKINSDWLRGEPMGLWMTERPHFPIIGPLFDQQWLVYLLAYSGLLLDLLIVPALLWRRTRYPALAVITLFHLMNAKLFPIGIFPWFMIGATTLFLPPDWPRRFGLARWSATPAEDHPSASAAPATSLSLKTVVLAVFVAIQVLVPLRHHLYPGDASWTEEGHLFSWRMKLREKRGSIYFIVTDPNSGQSKRIDPRRGLPGWQVKVMSFSPDLILQYAHHLADDLRKKGFENVEVRADVRQSLNGRRPQWLIDPNVNLAAQQRNLLPAKWIMPLTESLPPLYANGRRIAPPRHDRQIGAESPPENEQNVDDASDLDYPPEVRPVSRAPGG